ncbi:hypothetical protein DFH28DRAFT_893479 [Melampsora americana]|nr:hypothetical protein DFH28DRAFT_893479 [Melampsora americana]
MPSTQSKKVLDAVALSSCQPPSTTATSQKKKPRDVKSRKRPRRLSNNSNENNSASETDTTSTADPSRIVTQPTSIPTRSTTINTQPTPIDTQLDNSLPGLISDDNDELPTLENYDYENIMKRWPPSRCKARLALGFKGRVSKDGREEIKALVRKFEHLKMMMALALRCTMRTVNKQVAVPTKKGPSAYLYFKIFGKHSDADLMPHPDDEDISQKLGDYNRATGDKWSELDADQRAVFEHTLLLALAGIPDLAADHVESDDDDDEQGDEEVLVPEVTQLTDEEERCYRPIYEQFVNHNKVVARFGASGPGISDAKFTRRSLRCIQKYQCDLIADSHRHKFDFWLVASSSVPPLQPSTLTWCKVTTMLPVMTKWVTQKANFPTIFGPVSQGTSLIQAVSLATGSQVVKSQSRKNKSDTEKVSLGNELIQLLTNTIGERPRGLPRGPNIDKTLAARKDYPVRIVQLPGSTLTSEDLAKGFVEMNVAGRRRWKHDLNAKLFHFELVTNNTSRESEGEMTAEIPGANTEEALQDEHQEDGGNTEQMSAGGGEEG